MSPSESSASTNRQTTPEAPGTTNPAGTPFASATNIRIVSHHLIRRPEFWYFLGAAFFLYFLLFVPPVTPFYLPGDSSVYLLNASRMLEGQVLYKDFFQFTYPGTELFYFALLQMFGHRMWIPTASLICLGLCLTWVILKLSSKVLAGSSAFLPGLMFLTYVYWAWLDPSHQWFSTLLVMAAAALIIERRSLPRVVEAAGVCGLASFFTQIKGGMALLGIAVFLLWERRQRRLSWRAFLSQELYLFSAFFVALGIPSAYFIWKAGSRRFWYCTVEFGIKYYRAEWSNNLAVYMTGILPLSPHLYVALPKVAVFVFIHALLPLVYVIFFMRYRRRSSIQSSQPWDRLMLINILGVALFLAVAPAPAWTKLYAVSPPALILTVWLLNSERKAGRVLSGWLWASALVLLAAEPWLRQHQWHSFLNAPAGPTVCVYPRTCEQGEWLVQRTRPSEYLLEAVWADFYYPLRLRDPAPIPFLTTTDYTRPEQVRGTIEALETHRVRYVIWSPMLDVADPRNRGTDDHLGPLRAHLRTYYHVVKTFTGGDQVWERNEQAR